MALSKLGRLDHQTTGYLGSISMSNPVIVGDVVHYAYDMDPNTGTSRIFYRNYDIGGDSLSSPVQISLASGQSAYTPSIVRMDDGTLIIGMNRNRSGLTGQYFEIVESSDGGATWGNRASFNISHPLYFLESLTTDGVTVWGLAQQQATSGGKTAILQRTGAGKWSSKVIHGSATDYFFGAMVGGHTNFVSRTNSAAFLGCRNKDSGATGTGIYCYYTRDYGATWNMSPKIALIPYSGTGRSRSSMLLRIGKDGVLRGIWEDFNRTSPPTLNTKNLIHQAISYDFGATWEKLAESTVWYGTFDTTKTVAIKQGSGQSCLALDAADQWFVTVLDTELTSSTRLETMHTFKATGDAMGDMAFLDFAYVDSSDTYSINALYYGQSFFYEDDLYRTVGAYTSSTGMNEVWLLKNAAVGAAADEPGGGGGLIPKYYPEDPGEPI